MKILTFLAPPQGPRPISGGFRTLLRMMNYMVKSGYTISIEYTGSDNQSDRQREYCDNYNEINDINMIEIVSCKQDTSADIYVATGHQTFRKAEYYKSKGKCVVFFCQDLEWKFPRVDADDDLRKYTKDFYDIEIPTFTMSKFLGNYFKDQRILKSTSLNVDTDIYYNQSQKRDGICLLYCNPKVKPHRLGGLVMKLAKSLAERYPEKTISLYGDNNIPDVGLANVKRLNLLNNEQLTNLYNTSELGVVFSTTNPSRIAYEMVACGMPAIEADCEYTEYDMDSDAFVRIDPDHDTIINTIDDLLSDPKEMKRLHAECDTYSKNNFYKLAEEQRFLEFVENEVMEKSPIKTLNEKNNVLLVSVYYSDLLENLINYLNRLPFKCDVYLSCNNKDDYDIFENKSKIHKNIIKIDYPNGGMDIHPFFCQIEALKKSGKKYDYFLKIHTKNKGAWADSMYEAVLPEVNYKSLFENIDEYNVSGSDLYLYSFASSHANKNLILSQLKKFNLNINENDIWDTILHHDRNKVTLDPEFYLNYHNDLRVGFKNTKGFEYNDIKAHWEHHGINEHGRIANADLIKENAKDNFKFYAGTVFWFNQSFFEYLIKNTDDYSVMSKHFTKEINHVKNVNETYTHHLEYWFGLLASNLVRPKVLKGTGDHLPPRAIYTTRSHE
jgi:hypothetical protein